MVHPKIAGLYIDVSPFPFKRGHFQVNQPLVFGGVSSWDTPRPLGGFSDPSGNTSRMGLKDLGWGNTVDGSEIVHHLGWC